MRDVQLPPPHTHWWVDLVDPQAGGLPPQAGHGGSVLTTDGTTASWTAGSGATSSYRHVQASASTTWVITHGLSFKPNVAVVDSAGTVIYPGSVVYTSSTVVTLTFSSAVGGEAYLS